MISRETRPVLWNRASMAQEQETAKKRVCFDGDSRQVSHAPSDPGSPEGDARPERAAPALSSLNLGSASGELSFVVRISLSPMAS